MSDFGGGILVTVMIDKDIDVLRHSIGTEA